VESSEAIRRIFWRHRWLLLSLMILAAAAVVPQREHQPVNYAATATIQGQGTTPSADTQVQAIESRVSAVATAPDLVHSAISEAKVNRDATQVARHEVSVTSMGSSAILVLKVTDPSPQVAVALAGSLANNVASELNQLGIKDDPELALLSKTSSQLVSRRDQLLSQLGSANASNAATSVQVQSLLSQLGAVEQQLANNEAESQQVLATLTTETGAAVVSVPTAATGASRHVVEYGVLAALLGLVVGLLIATIREVVRPTVAQPGAGARELGAVLFGSCDAHGKRIVRIDRDLPERLNLAAHRAGVVTVVLTGPGSRARLAALAARLHDELPTPDQGDVRGAWARSTARIDHLHAGDDAGPNGDVQRPAIVHGGHRPVGLAADRPTDIATARPAKPQEQQRTVVALGDIRLGDPPPDAALVVVLPAFAPHSALDQAADLGVTADWPILGVIGIRCRGRLATLIVRLTARAAASPDAHMPEARVPNARPMDAQAPEAQEPKTVPGLQAPDDIHREREDD
jgi:capsular polysaccharide biosynthesis protein